MKVGIIGTGHMGSGLARHLSGAGHDVFVGSRDEARGQSVGADAGASGGSYTKAADHGEVVILAVPYWGIDESLRDAGDLSGMVLIDVTNPYKDDTYSEMHQFQGTSGAEETAKKTSASVVKCWNHVFAQIVNSSPDFKGQPATVFYCGDDEGAKKKTGALARDIGYEPVDAGPLSSARFIEALAGLVITLGYGVGMGTDIALKLIRR